MTGRWIFNRGLLASPCDGGGCKRFIEARAWYYRDRAFVLCEQCASQHGLVRQSSVAAATSFIASARRLSS